MSIDGASTRQLQNLAQTRQPRRIAAAKTVCRPLRGSRTISFRDVSAPLSCLPLFHGLLE